ncbi:MAG: hypothetical protein GY711_34195 [bacterium]|nr:hypothetical protein [bacterium]
MEPLADLKLDSPWLVAAWPGMGGVAQIAGRYLVQKLSAVPVAEMEAGGYFDLTAVEVREGIVHPADPPRSVFYGCRNEQGRDLVIFLGDQQPLHRTATFCETLLEQAAALGVERVVTFAALGTPIAPKADPRVFAVASHQELLSEVEGERVEVLRSGQIRGLNGLLVAAAAAQNVEALCLLGEFPFYASAAPNPKASQAVLRTFSALADLKLDFSDLDVQVSGIERSLEQHLRQLERNAREQTEQKESGEAWSQREEELRAEDLARVERLFADAAHDHSKAIELKAELDRQGLFKRFEDRFLDLFRNAE